MNFALPLFPRGDLAAERFGCEVLGPIFAEFAQRLWTFQYYMPAKDDTCLLFCARGGLRLRQIYEAFLAASGLSAPLPHADLMISRLVAARTGLAAPGPALLEELGREFEGQTMAEVVLALTQDPSIRLGPEWHHPFEAGTFAALLEGESGRLVRQVVARLDGAFRRHLDLVSQGRGRAILCDTGLYGSTVRLLQEGVPQVQWFAAQFARSNYKRFATPHFDVTVGLSVEQDGYCPWNARTCVLRFWHLIEAVLEPDLASVKSFSNEPVPRSNLEEPGWRERVGEDTQGLFTGVLTYLSGLSPEQLPGIETAAEEAWGRLRQAIIWPGRQDLAVLSLSPRARDFGRIEAVHQFPEGGAITSSLWREGAVVQRYRRTGRFGLALLEAAHSLRFLKRWSAARRA
ncbi:MAG: glycosyltransferase [Pseudomonadota bacterium]|nr:glycosyltransferase [Pseudomonadota bacterium]